MISSHNIMMALLVILILILPCLSKAEEEEVNLLDTLHRIRIKQEQQEFVIRGQGFMKIEKETACTPVQQTRQRLRDLNESKGDEENVTINAGHEEVNVTDNHGTINTDVNVQIIKEGKERECL